VSRIRAYLTECGAELAMCVRRCICHLQMRVLKHHLQTRPQSVMGVDDRALANS
jgi:hypothetical protein